VTIHTRWYTDGFAGFVERVLAPRMLRRVYRAQLNLLDRYARDSVPDSRPVVRTGRGLVSLV
jgi:hypothetical protein